MPVYTIDTVIAECVRTYDVRGHAPGAKEEIYYSSWKALNQWIETKLAKQLGAGVSGLGCFGWEIKQKDGKTTSRPIFVVSDNFVKNFKVKKDRVFRLPRTTPVEEVNFSNLAIKYTKNLTKDMMFIGIRDIVKRIGDCIYRGLELEVEFTFGTLKSTDRRIKFEFNQAKLADILPEAVDEGFYEYDIENDDEKAKTLLYNLDDEDPCDATSFMDAIERESYLSDIQSYSDKNCQNSAGNVECDKYSAGRDYTEERCDIFNDVKLQETTEESPAQSAPQDGGKEFVNFVHQKPSSATPSDDAYEPAIMSGSADWSAAPVELRDILDKLEKKELAKTKQEHRKQAVDHVLEQAFIRSLNEIETQAEYDDKITLDSTKGLSSWKEGLRAKKVKALSERNILNTALQEQLRYREQQREKEKKDFKESQIHVFLHDRPNTQLASIRDKLKADLLAQIDDKSKAKTDVKNSNMTKERDYLEQLRMEIDLHKTIERANHLEKQKTMLEAWERDGHVKNLKKVQSYGKNAVKDYIIANLGEIQTSKPPTPSNTLGSSLKMSIGYDPRKGNQGKYTPTTVAQGKKMPQNPYVS